jgi:hypothetical protein
MGSFKLGEEFSDWLELPSSCVFQTLTDAFLGICARGNVQLASGGSMIGR